MSHVSVAWYTARLRSGLIQKLYHSFKILVMRPTTPPCSYTPQRFQASRPSDFSNTNASRALASNFRFTLGALDTSRVASIESFTISRATATDSAGAMRDPLAQTGPNKFSNLVVVTADAGAATWTEWRDDFLARGNNADEKELAGTLKLLGPDMKSSLFALQISHVGITRFARNSSSNEAIPRSTATLYLYRLLHRYRSGLSPATPASRKARSGLTCLLERVLR